MSPTSEPVQSTATNFEAVESKDDFEHTEKKRRLNIDDDINARGPSSSTIEESTSDMDEQISSDDMDGLETSPGDITSPVMPDEQTVSDSDSNMSHDNLGHPESMPTKRSESSKKRKHIKRQPVHSQDRYPQHHRSQNPSTEWSS